jgi:hypothetical protein
MGGETDEMDEMEDMYLREYCVRMVGGVRHVCGLWQGGLGVARLWLTCRTCTAGLRFPEPRLLYSCRTGTDMQPA